MNKSSLKIFAIEARKELMGKNEPITIDIIIELLKFKK